ncbi:MAG TPA: proline dehydrogenase family protein [Candidatus Dormibacteraeota bacterium]|nr:proline dehydrogenase family protein [Candidatus Dormibacteraeota bacterium]
MRWILLWMARNRWLRDHLPRLWFARRAVRKFMPGETISDALEAGETFRSDGIGVLYTHLGENVTDLRQAQAVADHYHEMLDRIGARGQDAEISVKPTQLGLDVDSETPLGHLESLAAHSAKVNGSLWIDMEGSAYTDATLDLYRRLKAQHANAGVCLQAYLRRTPADVNALLPLNPQIRIVKGAYDEPADIAFRRKADVDAAFQSLCVLMLPYAGRGELRLALGTHDTNLIERVADYARGAGIGIDAFEVQMLYGIRTDQQRRLAKEGYRVRDLIAYGDAWYAWYMRRLAERPANVAFALRQLIG